MYNGDYVEENYERSDVSIKNIGLLGKTFLWLMAGLIVTGLTSFLIPTILDSIFLDDEAFVDALFNVVIGSSIYLVVGSLIIHISAFFRKNSIFSGIAFVLYSIAMGGVLSIVAIAYDVSTILLATGVTSLIFLGLGLYGLKTKANVFGFIPFVITFSIGCLILAIVNIFLRSEAIYYFIEIGTFAVFLIYIIIDANRVMRLQAIGENSNSVAVFCAYTLYTDFIYILLRILVIIANAKKK